MIMEGNIKQSNNLIINNKLGKNTKIKAIILLLILFIVNGVTGVTNIGCATLFGTKVSEEEAATVEVGDLGETISIIGEVVPKNE
ncbi:MAG: hypothetical protein WBA71_01695, partial [Candidatus Humimicrobiia bacterium]